MVKIILIAFMALGINVGCSEVGDKKLQKNMQTEAESAFKNERIIEKIKTVDFYKNGTFNKETAKEAYFDLMRYYGVPVSPKLKTDEFWVSDFAQKDFTKVGMGGIFWINNVEHGYFGHDIYLLPGQMLVEHKHHKVDEGSAKMETWQVRHGSAYFFSEGQSDENLPVKAPESQKVNCNKANLLSEGDVATLQAVEEWHFIIAGPKGAIISEYATPHFGNALEFSNKSVVF